MRLAMAQMCMTASVEDNLKKALSLMGQAKASGADIILFPELQFSPFCLQYEGQDAELILIPAANLISESLELFDREVRVQAFQNTTFIAMWLCVTALGGRVQSLLRGNSLAAAPDGSLRFKTGGMEQLCLADIPLAQAAAARSRRPWLLLS